MYGCITFVIIKIPERSHNTMALKNYSIRLDEEEYEKLKKYLNEHGDAEINIGFVLRQYIRDLNKAIPGLKTTGLDPRLTFSLIGYA
jgi:hypothetical protein